MSDDTAVSPTYPADLRRLVGAAFAAPAPVAETPLPWGTLQERIARLKTWSPEPLVISHGMMAADDHQAQIVAPSEYWERSLAHRCLILGPLLDIAATSPDERGRSEKHLLKAYHRYGGAPLPYSLLKAISKASPHWTGGRLLSWLDRAVDDMMATDTCDHAAELRVRLRVDALRHGATGRWAEMDTAIAEVTTDVLFILRTVRDDVERATRICDDYNGSVAVAFAALDDANDTTFEKYLIGVIKPPVYASYLEDDERDAIIVFASARAPVWHAGAIVAPRSAMAVQVAVRPHASEDPETPAVVADAPEGASATESAVEIYSRLVLGLEDLIIARPQLCRRLAIVGLSHVLGVRDQRVLICGTTGSGKSWAARSLAQVLQDIRQCPFMAVDVGDLSATGWKSADVPDLLDALAGKVDKHHDTAGPILLLEEVDKARAHEGASGNSAQASAGLMGSLLSLVGGQTVTHETTRQIDTSTILVLATGAFDGRFEHEPPTTDDLVRWGWMPELAARWGERLVLPPLSRPEAIELLRRSERSVGRRLGPLLEALGIDIQVPDAVLGYVADTWFRAGADYRSAAEWVLAAARRRLCDALEAGRLETIVLAPDDIVSGGPVGRRRS